MPTGSGDCPVRPLVWRNLRNLTGAARLALPQTAVAIVWRCLERGAQTQRVINLDVVEDHTCSGFNRTIAKQQLDVFVRRV
jgi:hypothetical protein